MKQVAATHGIIGLIPSEEVIGKAVVQSEVCPPECLGHCKGNIWAVASEFNEMADAVGERNVYLGTDFNGAMQHLPPIKHCRTFTPLDAKGLFNIGQTSILWAQLTEFTPRAVQSARNGALNFIDTWSRLY